MIDNYSGCCNGIKKEHLELSLTSPRIFFVAEVQSSALLFIGDYQELRMEIICYFRMV